MNEKNIYSVLVKNVVLNEPSLDLSPSLQGTLMAALHSSNIWRSDTYTMSTSTFASIETLVWKFTFWVFWMRNAMICFDFQDPG